MKVELVFIFVFWYIFSLHLHFTPKSLILAGYFSKYAGIEVLLTILTFDGVSAVIIKTKNYLFLTCCIMDLYVSIRALFSTMLALVIPVGTFSLKMIVEIFSSSSSHSFGQGIRVNPHLATCSSSEPPSHIPPLHCCT